MNTTRYSTNNEKGKMLQNTRYFSIGERNKLKDTTFYAKIILVKLDLQWSTQENSKVHPKGDVPEEQNNVSSLNTN